jgi:hypothetical protein
MDLAILALRGARSATALLKSSAQESSRKKSPKTVDVSPGSSVYLYKRAEKGRIDDLLSLTNQESTFRRHGGTELTKE